MDKTLLPFRAIRPVIGWRTLRNLCALLGICLAASGCYTLVAHPEISDNYRLQSPSRNENCLACHQQSGFQGNIWGLAPQSAAVREGGYTWFRDYPWWWAESATISRVIGDSSSVAAPVVMPDDSRMSGVFTRFRQAMQNTTADTTGSPQPGVAKDEKKDPPPEFRRRRR
ncbi:MAG: hypothetical protein KDC10_03465 [Calditrichaeota bacterium]|nr:hypothetical protein [Candidatus Cloacimonadota bacterium]MCA9784995.1 hypothetical protein [Candidatus Cloacimonadota bacterium]MCB1046237.1 hypothetical protein [Calditrichota bacterium]MCB9474216.1 hypothetical protein [Candidatus Delongbacteria bacterium]